MRGLLFLSALLVNACASAPPAPPATSACTVPAGLAVMDGTWLETTRAMSADAKAALVLSLPDCLESPDPAVRDGYAYETLSGLLRGEAVGPDTLRPLKAELLSRLARADEDPGGFRGPFAALALAEVARTDRIAPWMDEDERSALIAAAHLYLASLTDYRGFSDTEGWRHGIAHTADLLMQLSLNPHLTKPQAEAILSAIAVKAGTPDHAYVFGENERLAAPVMYLAQRDLFTAGEWESWFTGLWPAGDPLRESAYTSEAVLNRLHNLRAFAQSVYVSAVASHETAYAAVGGAALTMLNQLP
ncbi:DUF2785 domain-containing protein [Hyphomonas sp.]|uniref:DUF2785 domain-containing protein n=1 Tax=Hyphomonas sp. TaxID=87 RepID=UPI00391B5A43